MSGVIVDTSVWIYFFRGTLSLDSRIAVQKLLETKLVFISTVIKHEILIGSKDEREYDKLFLLLSPLNMISISTELEDEFNRFTFYLKTKGFLNNYTDSSIAFMAHFYELPVYSFDRYFSKLANERIINAFQPNK